MNDAWSSFGSSFGAPFVRHLTLAVSIACITARGVAQDAPPLDTDDEPLLEEAAAPDSDAAPVEAAPAEKGADEAGDADDAANGRRLAPIVVTARKWEELVHDVPESVTVLSRQFIEDAGVTDIREASYYVPNMLVSEFTTRRLSFPFIRGIGSGVGDPSVITYVDGVPQFSVSSTNLALLDVERLEFLRGPQGTLYGRNSMGGVIKYETRRPGDRMRFQAEGVIGNYGLYEGQLSFETPIVDETLSMSIAGRWGVREGYTTNTFTGNDLDSKDSFSGRAQFVWTPDERNEIRFTGYGEDSDDGPFALFSLDSLRANPYQVAIDFEGESKRAVASGAVTWNHYGELLDVTSITSYTWWDILETSDFDFSVIDGVRRKTDEDQRGFYQEVRVGASEESMADFDDDGVHVRWLAGVSFFDTATETDIANDFRPGGAGILFPPGAVGVQQSLGTFDNNGVGVFGQATLVVGSVDLTAGLRYDHERTEANTSLTFDPGIGPIPLAAQSGAQSFDEVLPKFAVDWRATDDLMVYGLAAKGFKAGGFNLTSPATNFAYGPETNWLYEIGLKTEWFDDALTVNGSLFYIDWSNMQLTFFDPATGGYVANAGAATSKGAEIELVTRPLPGLEIFGGAGYTDASFDQGRDQFGVDVSGNRLPFAPETTFNAGAQYGTPLGSGNWYIRGEYIHAGRYYYDAGNRGSDSFGIANFRLGYRHKRFKIEGWVRNAFEDDYVLVAFQPSPDPAQANFFVGENAAPRTFGVTMTLTF